MLSGAGGLGVALAGRGQAPEEVCQDRPGPIGPGLHPCAPAAAGRWPHHPGRRPLALGPVVGRPVPGLEVVIVNRPQPLAICLQVQSAFGQETLEPLAGLSELSAAELAGHRGGGGCGPGRRVRGNETESRRRGLELAGLG